jgi:site-specific DNA-methyltransferase (adenine-specific)
MTPYYADESVTLYHGDCREIDAWLQADVLVTDPPYGRNWKQGELAGHRSPNIAKPIANDTDTSARDDALRLWGDRTAVVFGDLMLAPPAGTKLVAVYRKPADAGLRGAIGGFRRDAEAIYLLGKWRSGIGGSSSVMATAAPTVGNPVGLAARGGHPHTKPQDVMETLIGHCPPGVIADPFAGSGSTLLAARHCGRKAIGVELDERYCEVIAKRLDQGAFDFGGAA